jgi:molybdenum cofactor synthesis domain-containing protein
VLALDTVVNQEVRDLTLEQAQKLVARRVPVVGYRCVPLRSALGSVLRQDAISDVDHPTADISRRDGYCLNACQTSDASRVAPVTLALRGDVAAGVLPDFGLAAGECARIPTGGVLPKGADTVVMAEEVDLDGDSVLIAGPVPCGQHVLSRGVLARKGQRVLQAGRLLTPSALGVLAAFGVEAVMVSGDIQVGVFATGDELVPREALPAGGEIRSSNTQMLAALVDEMRLRVLDAEIADDSLDDIRQHIMDCAACEVIITTGGTGMGGRDLVPECLRRMGGEIVVHGLNMRPGKSVIFGRLGHQAVFCLPGNPVGCFVLFHMLVRPALLAMMGCLNPLPVPIPGRWIPSSRQSPPVTTLVPSRLLPDLGVDPLEPGELRNMLGLAQANSIVVLPEDREKIAHDGPVDVYPLGAIPWTGA